MDAKRALAAAQDLQLESCTRERPVYFHGLTMLPILREGDELAIEEITSDEIRIGDVITYRHLDRYPTRRVVRTSRTSGRLVLKGDNIPPDQKFHVNEDEVLGRVTARFRDGQWIDTSHREWRRARRAALLREARWSIGQHGLRAPFYVVQRLLRRRS